MNTQRPRIPRKQLFRRSFQHIGRWQTNSELEPGDAAEKIAIYLRGFSKVETWLDGSREDKVLFKGSRAIREKSSPFNFINYGLLAFKKDETGRFIDIDYYLNTEKPKALFIFYIVNVDMGVYLFKFLILSGLKMKLVKPA